MTPTAPFSGTDCVHPSGHKRSSAGRSNSGHSSSGRNSGKSRRKRTRALLGRLAEADPAAREAIEAELLEVNLPVARDVARRFFGRGVDADDLEQVAALGLLKAIRGYDPSRAGSDLLSFAVPTMRGELRRHFRDHGWTVRPPRSVQELQSALGQATSALGHELGRSASAEELAEYLDADPAKVREAMAAQGCFQPSSLDTVIPGEDENHLTRRLGAEERGYDEVEARQTLARATTGLTERERRIVFLRFFRGCTQAEIGREIGVTQMQVSRLLSSLLVRMRGQLEAA